MKEKRSFLVVIILTLSQLFFFSSCRVRDDVWDNGLVVGYILCYKTGDIKKRSRNTCHAYTCLPYVVRDLKKRQTEYLRYEFC